MYLYQDRHDAGSDLAQLIMENRIENPLIFALASGGVPVASVISHEMGRTFEVLVTRKITYPSISDYCIGAMTEDERAFLTEEINYADPRILEVINEERQELRSKIALYRGDEKLPSMRGRNIILIDDGLSDGIAALAAARYLKEEGARKVVLAVPVAPLREDPVLRRYIDLVLSPHRVPLMTSPGQWYQDFRQVTDRDVLKLLGRDHFIERPTWHI